MSLTSVSLPEILNKLLNLSKCHCHCLLNWDNNEIFINLESHVMRRDFLLSDLSGVTCRMFSRKEIIFISLNISHKLYRLPHLLIIFILNNLLFCIYHLALKLYWNSHILSPLLMFYRFLRFCFSLILVRQQINIIY